jgi:hypothetical protein
MSIKLSQFRKLTESPLVATQVVGDDDDSDLYDDLADDEECVFCIEGVEACVDAVAEDETVVFGLNDGNTVEIDPESAAIMLDVYSNLNEAAADKFNVMMVDSIETFALVHDFCINLHNEQPQ